jgi:crossover junction endonuclease EME1
LYLPFFCPFEFSHNWPLLFQYIKVLIDPDLLNGPYGSQILPHLQSGSFQHEPCSQPLTNTITWRRKNAVTLTTGANQLQMTDKFSEENHVLHLMTGEELVLTIGSKGLLTKVQTIQRKFGGKVLTLVIYGLRAYCEKHRGCIGRRETEFALCEVQIMANCCYRMLETAEELGELVAQFSKSIAEEPFKRQKSEKYEQDEFYLGNDSRDCIRVTDGQGLSKLWQRQLTKLPQLSLEVAQSITNVYPMPRLLIEAYETAGSGGTQLLADLPVRRSGGPLATNKRIGNEISRRVYNLMMSERLDDVL